MSRFRSDRGAAAVEFALVVVPLLLLLAGIIDFGRAYNQQLALSSGARDVVRMMAVQKNAAAKEVQDAIKALEDDVPDVAVTISPTPTCKSGDDVVTVRAIAPVESLTGLFDPLFTDLTGEGVMKCGG